MNLVSCFVLLAVYQTFGGEVKLSKNIANVLIDNSFKTLDFLEKTYKIMEQRLDKLETFFKRCTRISYRKSLDGKIKVFHERIDTKFDSLADDHEDSPTTNRVVCINEAKRDLTDAVRNSTQTFNDCMAKNESRLKEKKRRLLNEIKSQELKVQENLCALMECENDRCLGTSNSRAVPLLTQSSINSTELPVKGHHVYIDEYRLQFDRCKRTIDNVLEKQFNERQDELHICVVGINTRIKE